MVCFFRHRSRLLGRHPGRPCTGLLEGSCGRRRRRRMPNRQNVGKPAYYGVLHDMCVFNHGTHATNHCVRARLWGMVKLNINMVDGKNNVYHPLNMCSNTKRFYPKAVRQIGAASSTCSFFASVLKMYCLLRQNYRMQFPIVLPWR